jgi:hypothetical protein
VAGEHHRDEWARVQPTGREHVGRQAVADVLLGAVPIVSEPQDEPARSGGCGIEALGKGSVGMQSLRSIAEAAVDTIPRP